MGEVSRLDAFFDAVRGRAKIVLPSAENISVQNLNTCYEILADRPGELGELYGAHAKPWHLLEWGIATKQSLREAVDAAFREAIDISNTTTRHAVESDDKNMQGRARALYWHARFGHAFLDNFVARQEQREPTPMDNATTYRNLGELANDTISPSREDQKALGAMAQAVGFMLLLKGQDNLLPPHPGSLRETHMRGGGGVNHTAYTLNNAADKHWFNLVMVGSIDDRLQLRVGPTLYKAISGEDCSSPANLTNFLRDFVTDLVQDARGEQLSVAKNKWLEVGALALQTQLLNHNRPFYR